ncbi:MAG TPA: hypothetical protein VJ859_05475 [Allosphingosinicella sp.]|nr:hypothetical protein [Allosphingosinicella sp.]
MTSLSPASYAQRSADAGRQIAQLRHILQLVEQIAGRGLSTLDTDAALDEDARISSAYDAASSIVQRRFNAVAEETTAWAAAGVEALLAAGADAEPPRAAAARLAGELTAALRSMTRILSL